MLIDEVHTPDSSRLWKKSTYEQKFAAGLAPDMFDKEVVRRYLMDHGYMGEGPIPELPPQIKAELVSHYLEIYQSLSPNTLSLEGPWEHALKTLKENTNEV